MSFEIARKIADAVLYEGYTLYPYRASSAKNRYRWQFGIVAPRNWSESGGESWEMQTECLIEPCGSPMLDITVRFLQVQVRSADHAEPWEEGVERTIDLRSISLDALTGCGLDRPFEFPGERIMGAAVLQRWPISGVVRVAAEPLGDLVKLRVRIENLTEFAAVEVRKVAMRRSLAGTHTLLSITGGAFVSSIDPPAAARSAAASCRSINTWPVLVGHEGTRDVMLSSPIILEDYPAIAPESPGDFFDATEIDEMLTLRVMTLTDDEKREAKATDENARRIIERCDSMPPEIFERLHGAIRSLKTSSVEDFFNPPGDEPELASVAIGQGTVSKGARVRLVPRRRADSMDLFLAGRIARVQAVHHDVEDRVFVAITVEDDPGADIHGSYGRFFYFYPDELELLENERTEI
jgi:hypothetical protein